MRRLLLNLTMFLSLFAGASLVLIWARSYFAFDELNYTVKVNSSRDYLRIRLASVSGGGCVQIFYLELRKDLPVSTSYWRYGDGVTFSSNGDPSSLFTTSPLRWLYFFDHSVRTLPALTLNDGVYLYTDHGFNVPLWLPLLLVGSPGGFLLSRRIRQARRPKVGRCAKCGYDLRASTTRCPECGTPFTRDAKQA
jgi:hypothetical protein